VAATIEPYDRSPVSVFRPSAHVTGPDGSEWEIYAYRIQLPGGRTLPSRLGALPRPFGGTRVLLTRLLWDVPRAALAALGSDEWTIEAVSWQPSRTSLGWRTTREYRGHVIAQVEGQLARGETPKPHHARYLGTRL